jgi:hypothetical protein
VVFGENTLLRAHVFEWNKGFQKEERVWKEMNDLAIQ